MLIKVFWLAIPVLFLLPFTLIAETAIQTDWVGGEGVMGPVTDWGNEFYSSASLNVMNQFDITLSRNFSFPAVEHIVDSDLSSVESAYSIDIDGDGDLDVLGSVTGGMSGSVAWWENSDTTPGTFFVKHTIDDDYAGPSYLYAADVNGDGYNDVLAASWSEYDITWWNNVGGTGDNWVKHTIDASFDRASSVFTGDIDNDGDLDILGSGNFSEAGIAWWENLTGTGGTWTKHTISNTSAGRGAVIVDIDNDGYLDVLWGRETGNNIAWWKNLDGTGIYWTEHVIDNSSNGGVSSVYSSDIDGDGDMDVLAGSCYDPAGPFGFIAWWENIDGSGTVWTKHVNIDNFIGTATVYSVDLDNDGDMDILGTRQSSDDILLWSNLDGSGTNWNEYHIDSYFEGATSVYAADLNGDEYLDILGSGSLNGGLGMISWWDVWGNYAGAGFLTSSILDTDLSDSFSWEYLDWTSTDPAGTTTELQVRASDDSINMGSWSSNLTSPCSLSTIIGDGDRYFQYRVNLGTTDSTITPTFHEVAVSWTPYTSTENPFDIELTDFVLYGASPNPAIGQTTLSFALPIDCRADLTVYDLTGRSVCSVSDDFLAGTHVFKINELANGVYLVRLTSSDFTATTNFVVIE